MAPAPGTMQVPTVLELAERLSVGGAAALFFLGLWRSWWVLGETHKREVERLEKDVEFWRAKAEAK